MMWENAWVLRRWTRITFLYYTNKKLDIKIQDIEHNLIQYIWSQSEDLYIITLIPEYNKKKKRKDERKSHNLKFIWSKEI